MNKVLSKPGKLIDLLSNYENIDHAYEIQDARAINDNLKNSWLWTADFWTATNIDNTDVRYNLTDEPFNLIFRHASTAIPELLKSGFYVCNPEEMKELARPENSQTVYASELVYEKHTRACAIFDIETTHPMNLPESNLIMARRVFGRSNSQYANAMRKLRDNDVRNIDSIDIRFINPEYVFDNTTPGQSIAQICLLGPILETNSYFGADNVEANRDSWCLRGTPKIISGVNEKVTKYYDIGQVLEESFRTSSFAPDQLDILRSLMEKGDYKIIKGG